MRQMPVVFVVLGSLLFAAGVRVMWSDARRRHHESALIERLSPYGPAGRAEQVRDWLRRN